MTASDYSDMADQDLLKTRVQERLDALDIGPITAATAGGLSRDFISDILNGKKRSVRGDKLAQLATALNTTPEYLLGQAGTASGGARSPTVPLVGYVGAGSQAHYYATADGGLGEIDAPEGATASTVAAEIRGESLGPALDGWLVFYDEVRNPVTPDLYGRLCVVGLPDDRILVKVIRPTGAPGRYHLISNSAEAPIFDQEVLWAAEVRSMKPR